jgi:hypothetical protein
VVLLGPGADSGGQEHYYSDTVHQASLDSTSIQRTQTSKRASVRQPVTRCDSRSSVTKLKEAVSIELIHGSRAPSVGCDCVTA